MSAAPTTHAEPRTASPLVHWLNSEHLVLWLALAYFVVLLPFTPGLASRTNLENLLLTLLPLFVVAIGQTLVLITGGIDLSVCSTMALASVLGALAMNGESGWFAGSVFAVPIGLSIMLLTGLLVGAGNGFAVAWLRLPPFIVTLTTMMFFSGLAIWLTNSKTIYGLPNLFNALGGKLALALPLVFGLGVVTHYLLARTLFGRWLYAVGGNPRAALVSGVPVAGVTASAYVASGVFAAIAAVLYTGQVETGSPVLGQRLLLDVIAATVIGGTSLFGGRGKVLWTLCGVLFIKLLDNSLNLLNLPLATIMMVKGVIILAAALLDALRTRRRHTGHTT
jgi:ribose/xylose/arabinose/galactoside ABC-type transport system permease subunit